VLQELSWIAQYRHGTPYWTAMIFMAFGEKDQTFQWLNRCYESPWMTWLKTDPSLDPLRSDPRYTDLLRRMGLPQ